MLCLLGPSGPPGSHLGAPGVVSSHSPPLSGQRPTVFLRTHLVPERAHMYIHSFRSYDGPRTEAQCPGDCLRSTEKDGEPQRGSVPCPRPSNFSGVAGTGPRHCDPRAFAHPDLSMPGEAPQPLLWSSTGWVRAKCLSMCLPPPSHPQRELDEREILVLIFSVLL